VGTASEALAIEQKFVCHPSTVEDVTYSDSFLTLAILSTYNIRLSATNSNLHATATITMYSDEQPSNISKAGKIKHIKMYACHHPHHHIAYALTMTLLAT